MGILIAGAGPSGLVLANVLAGHGIPFRIVDRKPGPVRESRAAIVHVRTLELLALLGLRERAMAQGVPVLAAEVYERGRKAAELPLAAGPAAAPLALSQDRTERLLVEGLAERGRAVEWNTELLSWDGAAAVLRGPDGAEERMAARWLVGADGASSRVRHALGLGFAGKTYQQTGLLADVTTDTSPPPGILRLNLTRGGFMGTLDLGDGRLRLFGAIPPGMTVASDVSAAVSHEAYARVSLAEIQRFQDLFVVGAKVTGIEWTALFRVHSRMAERFRSGNAFLVGDAAHIHSPAGGQGMNLGIGDAVNLGWKLALVAAGRADERLLDSYEAERLPVARTVLRGTDRGFALEATPSPALTWLRAHVATRLVGPVLRLGAARERVARLFSQTWITYRDSPIVSGPGSGPGLGPGERASPGTAPPEPRHHLLAPSPADRDHAAAMLAGHPLDVRVHLRPGADRLVRLIRPDGHVGFVGPLDSLPAYLEEVYGAVR
ncbi:FAD-dependent monooxygenase [Nonomuraea sp. 3N208]|uniref:FAD-dependent monooxygenase n=1 Tax=Nonomuraea sp. 3N208 TaxID=3457421 RepID=UPI003FD63917